MTSLTRRIFLSLGGIAIGTTAVLGTSWVGCRFVKRITPGFFALLETIPPREAVTVGRMALAARVVPTSLEAVEDALFANADLEKAATVESKTTRADCVARACEADFALGDTVSVDGWLLSRTEALLCAGGALAVQAV